MAEQITTIDENRGSHNTHREETLYAVLHRLISMIIFPDDASSSASTSLLQRIKLSVSENGPRLHEASRNTGRTVLLWTRGGSPLRALLVVSIGTISLLILTGLLVFMLFFIAATVNAFIVYLVISLASAGGFMALLFAYVTALYIGALSFAAFLISNATISAIAAVLLATGWVGVIWGVWLGTKKSLELVNYSFTIIGSAHSALANHSFTIIESTHSAYSSQLTSLGVL